MIRHVCEQAARASSVAEVIVATDDDRIRRAVEAFGGVVVMTRGDHPNGTSRIAEAAAFVPSPLIVNVQADEPEIEPGLIDAAVAHLAAHGDCPVGTVASPFAPGDDPTDPNVVKVVLDRDGRALLFSRALIPHARDAGTPAAVPLRHVGLYVYRREFLATYVALPPSPLEQTEQLEQLRILEHGHRIAVAVAASSHAGIDTEEQYDAFVERSARRGAPAAD